MDRTMNFDEIKLPQGVQAKYIGKKFYGKYYCKLVLKIDTWLIKQSKVSTATIRWGRTGVFSNRFELLGKLVKEVKQHMLNDDYRFRAEAKNISIFTNDVADLNSIIEKMPKNFCELYMPVNNNHTEILSNHRSVVVRNSLFDKKYKFKIYMKPYYELREARYSNIKEYLENTKGKQSSGVEKKASKKITGGKKKASKKFSGGGKKASKKASKKVTKKKSKKMTGGGKKASKKASKKKSKKMTGGKKASKKASKKVTKKKSKKMTGGGKKSSKKVTKKKSGYSKKASKKVTKKKSCGKKA